MIEKWDKEHGNTNRGKKREKYSDRQRERRVECERGRQRAKERKEICVWERERVTKMEIGKVSLWKSFESVTKWEKKEWLKVGVRASQRAANWETVWEWVRKREWERAQREERTWWRAKKVRVEGAEGSVWEIREWNKHKNRSRQI